MSSLAAFFMLGALALGAHAGTAHAQVAVVPPTGYETVVVIEAPLPPPGYGETQSAVPPPPPYAAPAAPAAPRSDDPLALRILAESGGYFAGALATIGLGLLVASATDTADDPTLFVVTVMVGVLLLPPLGTWLAGNAVEGHGGLGWTMLGNVIFGIFGSVLAYELSNSYAMAPRAVYGTRESDSQRRAQAGGLGFTLAF